MADLVIKNMEMPKYTTKAEFDIDADGNPLCMVYHEDGTEPDIYDVIPLPKKYGRLIDVDKLKKLTYEIKTNRGTYQRVINIVDLLNAPTIIEAEGGTDNGN